MCSMGLEFWGYCAAIAVGLVLGILGGGGSILTVPILVYLFGFSEILSTSYSLFIVGISSLIGAVGYMRKGHISIKTALIFALPSFVTLYFTRKYLIFMIPDILFSIGDYEITKGMGIMVLLGIIMATAAAYMIWDLRSVTQKSKTVRVIYWIIMIEGAFIGLLTGITRVGGGFIIVPALTLMVGLGIRTAVGTSLLIISMKAIIGFATDIYAGQPIDWIFLLKFSAFSVAGIITGTIISKYFPDKRLKKMFGYFILIMAVFIFYKELSS